MARVPESDLPLFIRAFYDERDDLLRITTALRRMTRSRDITRDILKRSIDLRSINSLFGIAWRTHFNDMLHGVYIERGKRLGNITYMSHNYYGKWHGMVRHFHANGQVSHETPWVHGKAHGVVREFREDGTLLGLFEYKRGVYTTIS